MLFFHYIENYLQNQQSLVYNKVSMRKILSFFWEIIKIVSIALLIVVPIRYFLFQPFFVKGQSMEPNFETGDYLIVDELSYRLREPKRGEVIVFKYPQNPTQRYIKRIIGLPGEVVEIEDGKVIVYRDGRPQTLNEKSYLPYMPSTSGKISLTLEKDEYFVLGDNRPVSYDSRRWGPLPRKDIVGRVFLRVWPFSVWATASLPPY